MINMISLSLNHVNHVILSKCSSSISSTYPAVLSRHRRAARWPLTDKQVRIPEISPQSPASGAQKSGVLNRSKNHRHCSSNIVPPLNQNRAETRTRSVAPLPTVSVSAVTL